MLRFVLNIFGAVFSLVTIGAVLGVVAFGGVLYVFSRDLPDHEQLAQYRPATISRIYSVEGRIIDDIAHELRLYTPID